MLPVSERVWPCPRWHWALMPRDCAGPWLLRPPRAPHRRAPSPVPAQRHVQLPHSHGAPGSRPAGATGPAGPGHVRWCVAPWPRSLLGLLTPPRAAPVVAEPRTVTKSSCAGTFRSASHRFDWQRGSPDGTLGAPSSPQPISRGSVHGAPQRPAPRAQSSPAPGPGSYVARSSFEFKPVKRLTEERIGFNATTLRDCLRDQPAAPAVPVRPRALSRKCMLRFRVDARLSRAPVLMIIVPLRWWRTPCARARLGGWGRLGAWRRCTSAHACSRRHAGPGSAARQPSVLPTAGRGRRHQGLREGMSVRWRIARPGRGSTRTRS